MPGDRLRQSLSGELQQDRGEERHGLRSPESERVRDQVFGPPGISGPAPTGDRSRRPTPGVPEPRGPSGRRSPMAEFLSQAGRGVVNTARPIARLNPIGGVSTPTEQQIAEQSRGMIAAEEPTTFVGRAGRLSGAAAGAGTGAGVLASGVSRSAATGGNALQRFLRFARDRGVVPTGEAFRRTPGRFVASETAAGAGAGLAGESAARRFPDSDYARLWGELFGGTATQIAPTRLAARGAMWLRNKVTEPFSGTGPQRRAVDRFGRATPVEGQREAAVAGMERQTTIDPETGQPVLSPAQRSEQGGLLALERAVLESSEELKRTGDDQIARANQAIQQSAREIGGGDPQDMAGAIEEGQQYLSQMMDYRLRIATQRANERIEALGKGASREDANRIAREEIENARKAASEQEDQLFGAVDPETAVPSGRAQKKLADWMSDLSTDQREKIPKRALMRLRSDGERFIGDTTNVQELRGLQQTLREEARQARSAGEFTTARIADDIADSIWDDIVSVGDQSQELQAAVEFSREFHQKFRRGAIGRMLGRDPQGGQRVPESLTLERTIGGGGPGEREALDQIREGLTDPTITARTGGDADAFNAAASDYMRQQFLRSAAPEGQIKTNAARNFLRSNDELLSRMPGVRREFEQAIESGNMRQIVENRRSSVRFDDPKVSRATLFVHKGPVKAFESIADDSPDFAARETQKLLNMAKKDPTGRAVAGLKSGYMDFLLQKNRLGQRDAAGESFVSGFQLRELRNNPSVQAAEKRLLSQNERDRLDTITRDLVSLDRQRDVRGQVEGIIADRPGKVVESIARLSGAAIGRHSAAMTGSGGTVQIPGIISNRLAEMAEKGVRDPATRLIRDAIYDEKLFRELLQANIGPNGELPPIASNRLNAWAIGVMNEQRQPESEPDPIPEAEPGQRLRQTLEPDRGTQGAPQ